jgi:hypothetical protein
LIEKAIGPWRHAESREQEIKDDPAVVSRADVIAFEWEGGDGIPPVSLYLFSCADGYTVTNIVPLGAGDLGQRGYNIALQDFSDRVAVPAAKEAGFAVEITESGEGLDDWLPRAAADALRRFSSLANKSTGSSHPTDRERWFTFLIAVHRDRGSLNASRLERWLIESERWPVESAQGLAVEYELALDLLEEYDRNRA